MTRVKKGMEGGERAGVGDGGCAGEDRDDGEGGGWGAGQMFLC